MSHQLNRRQLLAAVSSGTVAAWSSQTAAADDAQPSPTDSNAAQTSSDLTIKSVTVTPIALPDPPILFAYGCHGPYFLRNVIEIETADGIRGIGETKGGEHVTAALEKCKPLVIGNSAFAYRRFAAALKKIGNSAYAGIELACLDAIGRATQMRLCQLLGGPVREEVEFASYLFFRYAADHPTVLADEHLVDDRGTGDDALDSWGEVRSPQSMAELAWKFHEKWGFQVHKLKAGVLSPDAELETLKAMNQRFGGKHKLRIDPNGRWTEWTAERIGNQLHDLPLEYYEDPVRGQEAMARVRRKTGLPMSTNMCVTRFEHVPSALIMKPVDVVLGDHHGWGGITAFQSLGTISDLAEWSLSQHSNNHAGITMAAMIHVGAVVPQLTLASDTHYVHLVEGADIIEGPNLPIKGGRMQVPRGAGVGVDLDRDKLARAHEIHEKSGVRRRNDRPLMQRLQPGWDPKPL